MNNLKFFAKVKEMRELQKQWNSTDISNVEIEEFDKLLVKLQKVQDEIDEEIERVTPYFEERMKIEHAAELFENKGCTRV